MFYLSVHIDHPSMKWSWVLLFSRVWRLNHNSVYCSPAETSRDMSWKLTSASQRWRNFNSTSGISFCSIDWRCCSEKKRKQTLTTPNVIFHHVYWGQGVWEIVHSKLNFIKDSETVVRGNFTNDSACWRLMSYDEGSRDTWLEGKYAIL
jgi:hypothetical protein